MGREILILPFGILPLVLLAIYIIWRSLQAVWQRTVTDNHRQGETEFPTDIGALLCGTNTDELEFNSRAGSVVLNVSNAYCELSDLSSAQKYLKEGLSYAEGVNQAWAEQLIVTEVVPNDRPRSYKLTISAPRGLVLSAEYIEREIENVGRIFLRNLTNQHRFLLFPRGERRIEVRGDRVRFHIERVQLVPTFMGNWTDEVMSERQITRNIQNRLWNHAVVKCVSIDRKTYVGEIVLPAN